MFVKQKAFIRRYVFYNIYPIPAQAHKINKKIVIKKLERKEIKA